MNHSSPSENRFQRSLFQRPLFCKAFAVLSYAAALAVNVLISPVIPVDELAFRVLLTALTVYFGVRSLLSLDGGPQAEKFQHGARFYGAVGVLFMVWDVLSSKTGVLPLPFFPGPAQIMEVMFRERREHAVNCLYSLRLFAAGFAAGTLFGSVSGILIGWSDRWHYWLFPIMKVVGVIPAIALVPLVLIVMPDTFSTAVALVAISAWFPVAFTTARGIACMPVTSSPVVVEVKNVIREFRDDRGNGIVALDNVSLSVGQGEFVSLIGPSGCGKTSLLRLIAGLDSPQAGEILADGEPVTGTSHERGYVFQQANLFPWKTVEENVAFGLRARGVYAERRADVAEYVAMAGLKGFERAYPHQISGGMAQRAALVRSLINRPKALLLDEPMGALDSFTRMDLQEKLLELWQSFGTTMIMVTHDIDEAVYLSDRIVIMTPRPGKISEIIDIDSPFPRNRSSTVFVELRNRVLEKFHLAGAEPSVEYAI